MTKTKIFSVLITLLLSLVLPLQQALAFEWSSLKMLLPATQVPEATHDVAPYKEPSSLPDVANLHGEPIINGVILTWNPVVNANMYTIYYSQNSVVRSDQSYENQVMVEATNTHTITNLIGGTKYYFAVAAEDSTGKYLGSYNYSNEVELTPLLAPQGQIVPPAAPVIIQPVVGDVLGAIETVPVSNATPVPGLPEPVQVDPRTLEPVTTPAVISTPVAPPVAPAPVVAPVVTPVVTAATKTTTTTAPSKGALPGSGPELLVVFGISAVGTLLMKRKQKKI